MGPHLVPPATTRNTSTCGSGGAFSALKEDGSVVTWGDTTWGGDSSQVKDQQLRADEPNFDGCIFFKGVETTN